MNQDSEMDIDDALRKVGDFGRCQKIYVTATLVGYSVIGSVIMCLGIFTLYVNAPGKPHISTAYDEFGMSEFESHLCTSAIMLGVLVGNAVTGGLTDNYGRLKIAKIMMPLSILSSALAGVICPNWKVYLIWKFLSGFVNGAMTVSCTVLALELSGPAYWARLNILAALSFAFGICYLAVVAFFVNSWRYLHIVSMLPCVPFYFLMARLPESHLWFYSKGDTESAMDSLYKIGELNKTQRNRYEDLRLKQPTVSRDNKDTLGSLLKSPILAKRLAIMMWTWFVNSLVYYGLTLGAGDLGDNIYESTVFVGLAETPGYFLCWLLMDSSFWGRRRSLILIMTVCGICSIFIDFYFHEGISKLVLSLSSKAMIAASFSIIYTYTCELFPTSVRSIGLGNCSMSARIGGIVAPFVVDVGKMLVKGDPNSVYLLYAIAAISCGIFGVALPETYNKPMPNTIADVQGSSNYRVLLQDDVFDAEI